MIHLIRHGQTDWNRTNRIQGWAYTQLNSTGKRQAHAVGEFLASTYPEIDWFHVSDLPRAMQTAAIIREYGSFADRPIDQSRRLRERDFGVYQGFDSTGFFEKHPQYSIFDNGDAAAHRAPEKGESYAAFDRRIRDVWGELTADTIETDTQRAIVTHGGAIKQILAAIRGLDFETAIQTLVVPNCSLTTIDITDESQQVRRESDTSFLPSSPE